MPEWQHFKGSGGETSTKDYKHPLPDELQWLRQMKWLDWWCFLSSWCLKKLRRDVVRFLPTKVGLVLLVSDVFVIGLRYVTKASMHALTKDDVHVKPCL